MLKTSFVKTPKPGALILTVANNRTLGEHGLSIDRELGGAISWAMKNNKFSGAAGNSLLVQTPPNSLYTHIVLTGIGDPKFATPLTYEDAGGLAVAELYNALASNVNIVLDSHQGQQVPADFAAAHLGFGAQLRLSTVDKYKTKKTPAVLQTLSIVTQQKSAKQKYHNLECIAYGVHLTRNLINEPANVLTTLALADECTKLRKFGVKVDVLKKKQLQKLGMNGLLTVAQGSKFPPRLVVMSYFGDPKAKDKRPWALIGKGIVHDTGGLNIKNQLGMSRMHEDMAGAAAVMGAMEAMARQGAKANVVGVVAIAENMISADAMHPNDIIKMASGVTLEICDTDAEGRVVVADAINYTLKKYNPIGTVTLATIGNVTNTFGKSYAGLCTNANALGNRLTDAGVKVGEKVWGIPWDPSFFDRATDGPADLKTNPDLWQGGAMFTPKLMWEAAGVVDFDIASLDIACPASTQVNLPTVPKGPTGFGTRLLHAFVTQGLDLC